MSDKPTASEKKQKIIKQAKRPTNPRQAQIKEWVHRLLVKLGVRRPKPDD